MLNYLNIVVVVTNTKITSAAPGIMHLSFDINNMSIIILSILILLLYL